MDRFALLTTAAVTLILANPDASIALTKRSQPLVDRADDWNAGASCVTHYYNICTGWVWVWDGFGNGGRIGVLSQGCCEVGSTSHLQQSSIFVATSAPAGRGYTGTIGVYAADVAGCPSGPPLASQPFLPTSVFHPTNWGALAVPNPFILVVHLREEQGLPNPASFGSDHPAAGPTGPQACGVCFPASRVTRSFSYGTPASPLCPGSPFEDGVCDAELFWDFTFACPTSVEESSWGKLKNLYK
jgi:hypothetical protein